MMDPILLTACVTSALSELSSLIALNAESFVLNLLSTIMNTGCFFWMPGCSL